MSFLRALILILSIGFFVEVAAYETPALHLRYPLGKASLQTFTTLVEMETNFSDFVLSETIKQKVVAEVRLLLKDNEDNRDTPDQLEVVLKSLSAEIQGNDSKVIFDTEAKSTSLEFAQLKEILDRPMLFPLSPDYSLEESSDLALVQKDFPLAGEFLNHQMFSDMFQYLFILGGEELRPGVKLMRNDDIEVDINRADRREVQATFLGNVRKQESEDMDENVGLFQGILSGTGSWQSDNALLYRVKVHQSLSGLLENDGESVPVKMKITHWIDTKPL